MQIYFWLICMKFCAWFVCVCHLALCINEYSWSWWTVIRYPKCFAKSITISNWRENKSRYHMSSTTHNQKVSWRQEVGRNAQKYTSTIRGRDFRNVMERKREIERKRGREMKRKNEYKLINSAGKKYHNFHWREWKKERGRGRERERERASSIYYYYVWLRFNVTPTHSAMRQTCHEDARRMYIFGQLWRCGSRRKAKKKNS